ncbi:hypothetical protein D3C85_1747320 [compost metagenome]
MYGRNSSSTRVGESGKDETSALAIGRGRQVIARAQRRLNDGRSATSMTQNGIVLILTTLGKAPDFQTYLG